MIGRNWGCGDDGRRLKQGLAQSEVAAGNFGVAVGQTADWVQRAGRVTALGGAVAWAGVEGWGCGRATGVAVQNATAGTATREREREKAQSLPRRRRRRSRLEASAQTADESGRTPSRGVEPREVLGSAQAKANPSTLDPFVSFASWTHGLILRDSGQRRERVQCGIKARLAAWCAGMKRQRICACEGGQN